MIYCIEVDVIIKRLYIVEHVESAEEALTVYHEGNAEIDESHSEMENWEEQKHTARVI